MRVSAITPVYNRGYIICEALESLFAGTCRDFEAIVVYDGSQDDTLDVVSSIHRPASPPHPSRAKPWM